MFKKKTDIIKGLSENQINEFLADVFSAFRTAEAITLVPPDSSRIHSGAGKISLGLYRLFGPKIRKIIPALGSHHPMTKSQRNRMFGDIPESLFKDHDWRNDPVNLGAIDPPKLRELTGKAFDFSFPVQASKELLDDQTDLIISIGQVVPHEVAGMANFYKNILVGTGGKECIDRSHFIGAACNMEKIMGQSQNPVTAVFKYAADNFLKNLPLIYILTVVNQTQKGYPVKGVFVGDEYEVFKQAAELSQELNIHYLTEAASKIIVKLDADEFGSTWIGNKAIYRTRMAIKDGGDLIILAPGLKEFGEDSKMDVLIRKYGYVGQQKINEYLESERELQESLSAAAHLIHGSSEGRFNIIYCPGKNRWNLSKKDLESVGFQYGDIDEMIDRYAVDELHEGVNELQNGEKVFYIPNPALGLWRCK